MPNRYAEWQRDGQEDGDGGGDGDGDGDGDGLVTAEIHFSRLGPRHSHRLQHGLGGWYEGERQLQPAKC